MITVSVVPKQFENLYSQLVKKEQALRGKGAFYRSTSKRRGYEKWSHVKHSGWIWLQRCLGGAVMGEIQTRHAEEQWKILSAFVGFLDRYFKNKIASINVNYTED